MKKVVNVSPSTTPASYTIKPIYYAFVQSWPSLWRWWKLRPRIELYVAAEHAQDFYYREGPASDWEIRLPEACDLTWIKLGEFDDVLRAITHKNRYQRMREQLAAAGGVHLSEWSMSYSA